WTGSWTTVFVTIEPHAGRSLDADLIKKLRRFLEPFRLAGHDLEVNGPNYVALEIEMKVTAASDHFRSHVKEALLRVFTSGLTPAGSSGVFYPDNFVFGQPVYLSPLHAAALAVDGVAAAQVTKFQRRSRPDPFSLTRGKLEMGR